MTLALLHMSPMLPSGPSWAAAVRGLVPERGLPSCGQGRAVARHGSNSAHRGNHKAAVEGVEELEQGGFAAAARIFLNRAPVRGCEVPR